MAMALHFGATCMVTSAASITLAGTRSYLEFISGKVGPKCDVYSYGIVSVVYYAACILVRSNIKAYRGTGLSE